MKGSTSIKAGIDCLKLWNTSAASHFGSLGYDYWPSYALVVLLYLKSVTRFILISIVCMYAYTHVCAHMCMLQLVWFLLRKELHVSEHKKTTPLVGSHNNAKDKGTSDCLQSDSILIHFIQFFKTLRTL